MKSRLKTALIPSTTLLLAFFSLSCTAQTSSESLLKLLLKNEQELADAIAPGKKEVWMKYLHDSCIIVVEDGSIMTRKKMMEEFTPLPPGYDGHINVIEPKLKLYGN